MRLIRFVGYLLGYRWLWGRRKPKAEGRSKKRHQQKPHKPVVASERGRVKVKKVFPAAHHAWLTREDGKGEIFVHLDVAKAGGVQNLVEGQVLDATWGKSTHRKGRLDAVTLSS